MEHIIELSKNLKILLWQRGSRRMRTGGWFGTLAAITVRDIITAGPVSAEEFNEKYMNKGEV